MGKTIGERIEEMRIQAGAKNYKGHDYMDLNRFADDPFCRRYEAHDYL